MSITEPYKFFDFPGEIRNGVCHSVDKDTALMNNCISKNSLNLILEKSRAGVGLTEKIFNFITQDLMTITAPVEVGVADVVESSSRARLQKKQILQALSEYPNLANQPISEERIRLKSQTEPVRGSLYNWIKYYRDELGIGQHSTVERGQFLFGSENGKKISSVEREKLNLILKSLEENVLLEIDPERQVVIFPEITTTPKVVPTQTTTPTPQWAVPAKESPVAKYAVQPTQPVSAPKTVLPEASKLVVTPPAAKKSAEAYTSMTIATEPLLEKERLATVGVDVDAAAEKLKRTPKPEWIKGVFTKDNIPETLPTTPVMGNMSFSYNHALPAEQESKPVQPKQEAVPVASQSSVQSQVRVLEKNVPPKRVPASQFHIRPVSRGE